MTSLRSDQEKQQKCNSTVESQQSQEKFNSFNDGVDLDEVFIAYFMIVIKISKIKVLELRQRLGEREEELQRLKSIVHQSENGPTVNVKRNMNIWKGYLCGCFWLFQHSPSPAPIKRDFGVRLSTTSDHLNFAEPTEAEYLRNVLYRYMTERETLGRESIVINKSKLFNNFIKM